MGYIYISHGNGEAGKGRSGETGKRESGEGEKVEN